MSRKAELLALNRKLWLGERHEAKARAYRVDDEITDIAHRKARHAEKAALVVMRQRMDELAWEEHGNA